MNGVGGMKMMMLGVRANQSCADVVSTASAHDFRRVTQLVSIPRIEYKSPNIGDILLSENQYEQLSLTLIRNTREDADARSSKLCRGLCD
jgi:hypothetical protein